LTAIAKRVCVWALAISLFQNARAEACQCFPRGPKPTAAALVFRGRVVADAMRVDIKEPTWPWDSSPTALSYEFEVEKVWKGNPGPFVAVITGLSAGACGVPFKKGKSYLVLASRVGDLWGTTSCNAVQSPEEEAKVLADLGTPRAEYVRVTVATEPEKPPPLEPPPSGERYEWAILGGFVGVIVGYLLRTRRRR
jgi:hypothetical protein